MTTRIKPESIAASAADTVIECGLASQPPKHRIDHTGPEAALGKAVHGSLEAWVNNGFEGEPEAQPYANQHGVAVADVERLIDEAPGSIRAIREDLISPKAEVRVKGGGVRGIIDVLSLQMAGAKLFSACVLDWKTGRDPNEGGKPGQRLAYASAVEANYGMPATGYIYTAEIWLSAGEILESRYDLDSIQGFRAKLAEQLKYQGASPGRCCKYCPRRHECEPRKQYTRAAIESLAKVDPGTITGDALGELWDKSRAVKRAVELYETLVDVYIDNHGGLPLPDGRRMIHAKRTREVIDARKAWPIMRATGMSSDEINAVVRISKSGLLEAISSKLPKGGKTAGKTELMTKLDLAGAISRTESKVKKITK
jgi:hypothetical protein